LQFFPHFESQTAIRVNSDIHNKFILLHLRFYDLVCNINESKPDTSFVY